MRILALVLILCVSFSIAAYTATQAETTELREIYIKCQGSGWKKNGGWLAYQNPCYWDGVKCSSTYYDLDLSDNNLICDLSSFKFELPGLRQLDLHGNDISGSLPFPSKELPNLSTVDLSENKFSGKIPDEFFVNLRALSSLDISQNKLEGPIPESFSQMASLNQFKCVASNLEGVVPNLNGLPVLNFIDLSANKFSGRLPLLGESLLKKGAHIDFSDNLFNCPKPVIAGAIGDPYATAKCTCPLGSFGNELQCKKCPAGHASDKYYSDSCVKCAETEYAPVPGSTKCLPCPLMMYAPPGSARCTVSGSLSSICFVVLLVVTLITMIHLKRTDDELFKKNRGMIPDEPEDNISYMDINPMSAQPLLTKDDYDNMQDDDEVPANRITGFGKEGPKDDDQQENMAMAGVGTALDTVGKVGSMVVNTVVFTANELVQAAAGINRVTGRDEGSVPQDEVLYAHGVQANEVVNARDTQDNVDIPTQLNATPISNKFKTEPVDDEDEPPDWAKDSMGVFNIPEDSESDNLIDFSDTSGDDKNGTYVVPNVPSANDAYNNIITPGQPTIINNNQDNTDKESQSEDLLPNDSDTNSFDLLPSDESDEFDDMSDSVVHFKQPSNNDNDDEDDGKPVELDSIQF